MRKLGDQWIEIIDGVEHMVKAVEKNGKCTGCIHLFQQDRCHVVCKHPSAWTALECPFKVIDLGILRDGCLSSPFGGYPTIIHEVDQNRTEDGEDVHYDNLWCVEIHEPVLVCTNEYPTEQEAKDAWNRRA